jgi:hypothetical protein
MTVCMGAAFAFTGTGALIALIDTFLPAGALALALADADNAALRHLRRLLQCLFVLNATIALVEAALQLHLFPVPPDPSFAGNDFRPVGLTDHPLTGATATMLGWMLRPDFARAPLANLAYQGLMIAALSAFAERAPLALGLCGAIAVASTGMARRIAGRHIRPRDAVSFVTAPLAIAALLGVAIASGIGQRLGAHLYWDDSAGVRLSAFNILFMLSAPEWIFGTRREDLIAMIEPLRLTYHVGVIENFWLVMLVTLGVIGFPVFVASLASLLTWLWRQADRTGRVMVFTLVVASSCSNSLGRKSMLLVLLVACVLAAKATPFRRQVESGSFLKKRTKKLFIIRG